jgi:mono/diheme cytochrome c family protein
VDRKIGLLASSCLCFIAVVTGAGELEIDTNAGIFTSAQATRGEQGFVANCISCHGSDLAGGERAPALAGDLFLRRWQGRSVGDLFRRIRATMPQQSPRSLTDSAYINIISFIIQANGFPSGGTALSADLVELDKILLPLTP